MNERKFQPDDSIIDSIDDIGKTHDHDLDEGFIDQEESLKQLEDFTVNKVETDDFMIADPDTGSPMLFPLKKKNLFLTFSEKYIRNNFISVLDNLRDLRYEDVQIAKVAQKKNMLEEEIQKSPDSWILKDTYLKPKRGSEPKNDN